MANDFYLGIPLNKAIIVRHVPNDERDTDLKNNQGAVPMSLASKALDYAARQNEYADKSDIDRSPTRDDLRLQKDYHERTQSGIALDYISRMGIFESKGADRQVDASLWNQFGPVDPQEVEREMIKDGGAFIDSLVSVKREYCRKLGLETKEDFQRLMRKTWTESVKRWELIKDPADIRWVAAFHSDANQSLHVHVYTWSAKGEIKPGATIKKYQTRRAKEVILNEGYASVRQERDRRATFLRDLSILEIKRQLGLHITQDRIERITNRAEVANYPERLSKESDVSEEAKVKIINLANKLERELENGSGKLSKNYQAQATAKDLLRTLEEESPALKRLKELRVEHAEIKATIHGLSPDDEDRYSFVKSELKAINSRLTTSMIKSIAPHTIHERPLRRDLTPLDARERKGYDNISFSRKLIHGIDNDRVLVRVPYRRSRLNETRYIEIPTHDTGSINRGQGRLAIINEEGRYKVYDTRLNRVEVVSGERVIAAFGRADMSYISRINPDVELEKAQLQKERAERQEQSRLRAEKYRQWRERVLADEKSQMSRRELKMHNKFSLQMGVSLDEAILLSRDARILMNVLKDQSIESYAELPQRDKARVDRIAKVMLNSPTIQQKIHAQAQSLSEETGKPAQSYVKSLKKQAMRSTREMVVDKARNGGFSALERSRSRQNQALSPSLSFMDTIGSMAATLLQDQSSGDRHRFNRKKARSLEQEQSREHSRARSR